MNQREQFVQKLFDRIAPRYDLLNRVISLRFDTRWRKKLIEALDLKGHDSLVLDLGTGTGDLALAAAGEVGTTGKVIGLDFSREMVALALQKKNTLPHGHKTGYIVGSALAAPFQDEKFDAIMTAFVLRNVVDRTLFFRETYRLLRPGGKVASLDMFPPDRAPFSLFYSLYFYRMVPWIGAALAHDHRAYRYLSDSVRGFDPPEAISKIIQETGFRAVSLKRFLVGAVCLHTAEK
ncbi:MAG: ubiquinone/menaquinone biosynthesis methyltransferase, partial [Candidatus Binatia bacterium]